MYPRAGVFFFLTSLSPPPFEIFKKLPRPPGNFYPSVFRELWWGSQDSSFFCAELTPARYLFPLGFSMASEKRLPVPP